MKKTESREVEIKYCDFCGEETECIDQCNICGKEMCDTSKHAAYSLRIYKYNDSYKNSEQMHNVHICHDCAQKSGIDIILDNILERKYTNFDLTE